VLHVLATGLADNEIAEQLHVRHETVRTHMVSILNKLGVNSRLKALVFAMKHGLVSLDAPDHAPLVHHRPANGHPLRAPARERMPEAATTRVSARWSQPAARRGDDPHRAGPSRPGAR